MLVHGKITQWFKVEHDGAADARDGRYYGLLPPSENLRKHAYLGDLSLRSELHLSLHRLDHISFDDGGLVPREKGEPSE